MALPPRLIAACTLVALGLGLAPDGAAQYAASGSQTWTFDETTTGGDVAWTSPTSVDPAAAVYTTNYTLTAVDVGISWQGIPFGTVDVLAEVPPEQQSASNEVAGPAPIALADTAIVFPEPPEAPAIAATISIGVDAGGSGFFDATGITLGSLQVDLGFPLGTQTVDITSLRVAGSLTIHPTWFDLGNALAGTGATPVALGSGPLTDGSAGSVGVDTDQAFGSTNLVFGFTELGAAFKGGTLVPFPDLLFLGLPLDANGDISVPFTWPSGVPPRFSFYVQWWTADPGAPAGFSASNALRGETP